MAAEFGVTGEDWSLTREEFQGFYEQTAPALRRYIRGIAPDSSLADDILQESYIRLLGAAGISPALRKPYLYRVAHNLAADHWRARRREQDWLSALLRRPEAAADRTVGGDLERWFRRLNVRQRALLWLAHVEEASHEEIAEILRLEKASVRVLLFRARRKMEAILRKEGYRPRHEP